MGNNGASLTIAASIFGSCGVGGSFLISQSVDRMDAQVPVLELAVENAEAGSIAAPAPSRPRRRRPDPDEVDEVAIAGSASKGPASAKIEVVEFSDFQ